MFDGSNEMVFCDCQLATSVDWLIVDDEPCPILSAKENGRRRSQH